MTTVQRGAVKREGIIEADIAALWDVLIDWGNHDWWGNELETDGMKVDQCYLEGERNAVPRTKVLVRSNAENAGLPLVNRETLFREDHLTHRLYYDCSDGFVLGVRNYIASWCLDPLPDGRCRMTVACTFDVLEPGDAKAIHEIFAAVYDMIFTNLNRYMAKRNSAAVR